MTVSSFDIFSLMENLIYKLYNVGILRSIGNDLLVRRQFVRFQNVSIRPMLEGCLVIDAHFENIFHILLCVNMIRHKYLLSLQIDYKP